MANRHVKRCSTSVIIREMQIKTTLRYHLTPVRMVSSVNQQASSVDKDGGGKGTFMYYLLVAIKIGAATVESSMSFLKKLKMKLPYDPAIPLLGIYLKKPKTLI